MQSKTTVRCHSIPIRLAKRRRRGGGKGTIPSAGQDAEQIILSYMLVRMQTVTAALDNSAVSHIVKHTLTIRSSNYASRY